MNNNIKQKIIENFLPEDQDKVIAALTSITLKHVMAESQNNLDNTWLSIIQLSKGNPTEVNYLVEAAKKDFRDVIYWAHLELQQNNSDKKS
jgi:uncharacterized alpha/beta hydrolase family protein